MGFKDKFNHFKKMYFQGSKTKRMGYRGEYITIKQLEKIPGYKKIIPNILFQSSTGRSTEIDIVMIHETGIYIIENKNYNGIIGALNKKGQIQNINATDRQWASQYGKKTFKFYNPILQNEGHIKVLKYHLRGFTIGPQRFFSYIVFNDNARIKGLSSKFHTSVDVNVGLSKNVVSNIKNNITSCSKVLTPTKIDEIESVLERFTRANYIAQAEHVKNVSRIESKYNKTSTNIPTTPFVSLSEQIQTANKVQDTENDINKEFNSNKSIKSKSKYNYNNVFHQ